MRTFSAVVLTVISISISIQAQTTYFTNGGELLFQFANVTDQGNSLNDEMRFTLFFHTGSYFHVDFNPIMGIYTGTAVRNVGYIVSEGQTTTKRRAYSLGVPLALKLGIMKRGTYLFAGGEYEWFFHYKEKILEGGRKTKYREWFSPRVNTFVPSFFAGIQLKGGMNIKAKFYLDNFMNQDFRDVNGDYPYRNLTTGMFYFSLSWIVKTRSVKKIIQKQNASYAQR
ncbi:MAG: hypothetical protein GXO83_06795 [Chlorobi bacterium]|nr:hypothetical protein [Chlorobiota bacterium]